MSWYDPGFYSTKYGQFISRVTIERTALAMLWKITLKFHTKNGTNGWILKIRQIKVRHLVNWHSALTCWNSPEISFQKALASFLLVNFKIVWSFENSCSCSLEVVLGLIWKTFPEERLQLFSRWYLMASIVVHGKLCVATAILPHWRTLITPTSTNIGRTSDAFTCPSLFWLCWRDASGHL